MNDYVIRFGNHWMVLEPGAEPVFIDDRSLATRFDKWHAEAIKASALTGGRRLQVMTFAEALADADETRKRRTRTAYFYAVERIVRERCPAKAERTPGVGCAPFAFYIDAGIAEGRTPEEAAELCIAGA